MSTADSRRCSVCLRWLLRLPETSRLWGTNADGEWVCPSCVRPAR